MNKQQLIDRYNQFLQDNNVYAVDVVVGAGGVLCLLGLREETSDIDVDVPCELFMRLIDAGHPTHKFGDVTVVSVTEHIDVHLHTSTDPIMITDGVTHYTPEATLEFKRRLNRAKDQADINALERYLAAKRAAVLFMHK